MRVLMFGWEFPPFVSGGLGVACEGLVRGLLELGVDVTLVLPRSVQAGVEPGLRLLSAFAEKPPGRGVRRRSLRTRWIASALRPYPSGAMRPGTFSRGGRGPESTVADYGPDLPRQVFRYARAARRIAERERFDVIHAHDWLTFLAGLEAREGTGKPLVLHVHSTELDRAGPGAHGPVGEIERLALSSADRVVAVSGYTSDRLVREYGVAPERIRVVHNAIDFRPGATRRRIRRFGPLVLFAGRITRQKGPEYFVEAAARVAAARPDVRFVVAGSGDREAAMVESVAVRGLTERFLFAGFLPPEELDRLYARADVFVLPSESEPFGLAALEALRQGTPAIVSKDAGVSEVVAHILRVRYGDVEDLASKILSVLAFPALRRTLSSGGLADVGRLSWRDAAGRCVAVYRELVRE